MSASSFARASILCLALGAIACGQSTPGGQGTGGAGEEETGGSGTGGATATGGRTGTGGAIGTGGSPGGATGTGGAKADAAAPDAAPPVTSDAGAGGGGSDGSLAALDRACTPKIDFKLMDTGPKGQLFLDAMGGTTAGVTANVQQIGRDVCRVLYRDPSEVRAANEMELIIRDYDGVAAKWGDIGRIGVEISTRHLQNVKNEGRDVASEVKGILYHEITHMFQHDDKPEGRWPGLAAYYEAGADAVRIRAGFAPAGCRPGGKTGQWHQLSYCTGGWWWLWVDTKHPGFIYKLNLQMKGGDGKAWTPAEATAIAGVSLDDLWKEYQGAACCSGANTTCCK